MSTPLAAYAARLWFERGTWQPPRPTARQTLPFLLVALIGMVHPAYTSIRDGRSLGWLALALLVGCFVLQGVSLSRPRRTWIDPMAAFLFFAVIGVARDVSGGKTSVIGALVILPIVWLALTGTRLDVGIGAVLTAATFTVPVLLVGAPEYPVSELQRTAIWTLVACLVAPVVNRLVAKLEEERRSSELAHAELHGMLRAARQTSMLVTDDQGLIRSFSAGAEEILGFRADEVVGRMHLRDIHDCGDMQSVAAELGVEPGLSVFSTLAAQSAPSRVWLYRRADGELRHVRMVVTELLGGSGRVRGLLHVGIDVTEEVHTRRELEVAEARWRLLLDQLPDLTIMVIGDDYRARLVSGAGARLQQMGDVTGRPLRDFSANAAGLELLVDEALGGHNASAEYRSTQTGEHHEVLVTRLPDHDEHGPEVLLLGRNVSEARKREYDISVAKERAERLFDDAPHGVAVLDVHGVIRQANKSLAAMAGRTSEELLGLPLASLSAGDGYSLAQSLRETQSNAAKRATAAWTLQHRDGHEVHVELTTRVLPAIGTDEDVVLVNAVDVSERRVYEERLRHLASHDALTGLANRRQFEERLTQQLDRCGRYGPVGALILLDLDHFKEVNDTLGHEAGDQLLISAAKLIEQGTRETDVVARLGGDEFAVLLTEGGQAAATVVANGIVERIRQFTSTLDGTRRRVTASVGVVSMRAATDQHGEVLALADLTMYDAKEAGRNQVVVLDEREVRQPRVGARLAWKDRIERALEDDRFTIQLQPILDLDTQRVVSAEALVRMVEGPDVISPGRFLYIAERSGLAPEIDAWVVREGVKALKQLRAVAPDFQLEVNLSGHSIGKPAIEQQIIDSLESSRIDPSALVLEITETAAVADVQQARRFAERMTRFGCKFALDDFGAGFGSFYYLKHLLFDYVKIDGEFVANVHHSAIDRTILRSIVGIAQDLGKKTVAEFVAEPEILDVVREEGVDLAQGYLIGKPMSLEELIERHLTPAPSEGVVA